MIGITRFDGTRLVLNSDSIQYVEATPDTIITLTTGDKLMVRESVEEVIAEVVNFKRQVFAGGLRLLREDDVDYIE